MSRGLEGSLAFPLKFKVCPLSGPQVRSLDREERL